MCDVKIREGPLRFPRLSLINDTIPAQRRYEEFFRTEEKKLDETIKNHNQLIRILEAYRQKKRLKQTYYTNSTRNVKKASHMIQRLKKALKKHNSDVYLYDSSRGTLFGWRQNPQNYRLESEGNVYCRQGAENVLLRDLVRGGLRVQSRLLDLDSSLKQTMAVYDIPQNEFQRSKFEFRAGNGRRYQSGWYPQDLAGKVWVNAFSSDENFREFIIALKEADRLITRELFFLSQKSQPNCSKVLVEQCGRTRGCEVKTSTIRRKRYCAVKQCSGFSKQECDASTQCEWRKSSILKQAAECRPIGAYKKQEVNPI